MHYIYEEPKELIQRVMQYIRTAKTDGILSIEVKLEDEPNEFLKLLFTQLVDNISPQRLKSFKKFIKYYVKELNYSKKKKYKIRKQLKMIYRAAELQCEEEAYSQIETELYNYYPQGFIQIGDCIRATGETSDVILYGEVTYVDEVMEMVFFSQLDSEEELVVTQYQITDNFGKIKKLQPFLEKYLVDNK